MKIGDRVFAESELYTSWGTVTGIFPGELFPIQIEMETPDDQGHSLKRFAVKEITIKE